MWEFPKQENYHFDIPLMRILLLAWGAPIYVKDHVPGAILEWEPPKPDFGSRSADTSKTQPGTPLRVCKVKA